MYNSGDDKLLTIAIPTYNRNEKLKQTLGLLLPQLKQGIKVKVLDNCSDLPVVETLSESAYSNIEVLRHEVNVGMSANFIKCFEVCDTEWLWILGDDDLPNQDAINTIMRYIKDYSNIVFFKFDSNLCQYGGYNEKDIISRGQNEFIYNLKSFPNLLFLSSGLYKASEIIKSIKNSYYFSSTFAPHISIVLDYLRIYPEKETIFSSDSIVQWKTPDKGDKWGDDVVNKSVQDIVFIIKDDKTRVDFFGKITPYHPYNFISAKDTFVGCIYADDHKKYDLIADYFASESFVTWSARSRLKHTLIRFLKISFFLLLLEFRPFKYIFSLLYRKEVNPVRSAYNKFLFSLKENRL